MSSTAETLLVREPSSVSEPDNSRMALFDKGILDAVLPMPSKDSTGSSPPVSRGPLAIQVIEGGHFLVEDIFGLLYGEGASEAEAIEDYLVALRHHLRFLRENHHRLSPEMQKEQHLLERLFPRF